MLLACFHHFSFVKYTMKSLQDQAQYKTALGPTCRNIGFPATISALTLHAIQLRLVTWSKTPKES
jgi:hypothetical protein